MSTTSTTSSFDLDALVVELRAAAVGPDPAPAVKALLTDAVSDPAAVRAGMPVFEDDDVILFEDETVSIWHCRFPPGVQVPPHDHQIRATIGMYDGAERNEFFEATDDGFAKSDEVILSAGQVLQIDGDMIHAVSCASDQACSGIHVYLGTLTTVERSLFDPETGQEMPMSDENYERLTNGR